MELERISKSLLGEGVRRAWHDAEGTAYKIPWSKRGHSIGEELKMVGHRRWRSDDRSFVLYTHLCCIHSAKAFCLTRYAVLPFHSWDSPEKQERASELRDWFIYFKELALVIVWASKYEISRIDWQTGISVRSCYCSLEFEICRLEIQARFLCCSFGAELLLLWETLLFVIKAFSWLDEQPLLIPIMEGNLLYSEYYWFKY